MQEGGDEFMAQRRPDHTRAQDEHIHVVMFHTLVRRICILKPAWSEAIAIRIVQLFLLKLSLSMASGPTKGAAERAGEPSGAARKYCTGQANFRRSSRAARKGQ